MRTKWKRATAAHRKGAAFGRLVDERGATHVRQGREGAFNSGEASKGFEIQAAGHGIINDVEGGLGDGQGHRCPVGVCRGARWSLHLACGILKHELERVDVAKVAQHRQQTAGIQAGAARRRVKRRRREEEK